MSTFDSIVIKRHRLLREARQLRLKSRQLRFDSPGDGPCADSGEILESFRPNSARF
ncbi:hypothetical protein HanLR1_Chr02g0045331 [Helianthus annuus]|nr:hypothetical protein HanLR1_Chr02g0045331 [Helianthus annuus]